MAIEHVIEYRLEKLVEASDKQLELLKQIDHKMGCIYKELINKSLGDMISHESMPIRNLGCFKCGTNLESADQIRERIKRIRGTSERDN